VLARQDAYGENKKINMQNGAYKNIPKKKSSKARARVVGFVCFFSYKPSVPHLIYYATKKNP